MPNSNWMFIDSQDDLNKLNSSFYWGEGAQTVEFYGCLKSEPYFPQEISRSSMGMNMHLLIELRERETNEEPYFVEFVLIDCDQIYSGYLQQPHFIGRVDSLKRVYLEEGDHTVMRCARVIYRFIHDELYLYESAYFKSADSV